MKHRNRIRLERRYHLTKIPHWHDFANEWAWQSSAFPAVADFVRLVWQKHGKGASVIDTDGLFSRARDIMDASREAYAEMVSRDVRSVNMLHMQVIMPSGNSKKLDIVPESAEYQVARNIGSVGTHATVLCNSIGACNCGIAKKDRRATKRSSSIVNSHMYLARHV